MTGRIQTAARDDSIQQSIRAIIGTARGERVMRPDFGCGLQHRVFDTLDSTTLARAAFDVREALIEWEPRIEVLEVDARPDPGRDHVLLIAVSYRVRTTNTVFNQVYPYLLERSRAT
ncbi:MAG: GPW/gp25 family protein [Chloroflexota bacterium]